ncbi:MAG: di-heme-cytochrome C peroxidase [Methylococcales bacterium]|nr:di-heme-cytochrome C peroxidase [Methylococcales bacterium]
MKTITPLCAAALLLLTDCTYVSEGVVADKDRYAETSTQDIFGDTADKVIYLDQNWDRYDSLWFYFTTQGSDFMPYEVFLALEQADSTKPFRNAENMNNYRFLTQKSSYDNPDGLPIGFVKDDYQGKDYMGFTCAACHTTQINYKNTGIRIDGAPALADFEGFFEGIEQAVKATLDDTAKFNRLAKVMVDKELAENPDEFRKMLEAIYRDRNSYNVSNAPKQGNQLVHYGYGRLDAFGRIFNRILENLTPNQANTNPVNAPVSYPFLWDTPHHDFVQWNGVSDNNPGGRLGFLGPLSRNTGEVLGVFASFDLQKHTGDVGYRSSVVQRNLVRLEEHLVSLESPVWPETILPPIDRKLADQGKQVFSDYKCDVCHSSSDKFDRSNPDRRVIAQFASLQQIGTDPVMAINALQAKGNSGVLKGETLLKSNDKFGDITPALPALQKVAGGVILEPDHDKSALRRGVEQAYDFMAALASNPIEHTERHVDFEINDTLPNSLLVYKARPLNGIWATAPYLHNGSVPTLYELFLPSCSDADIAAGKKCRPNRFTLGSREFDPVKVGFVSKPLSTYPRLFEFDTSLAGNRNNGHEYAAGNTPIIKLDKSGKPIKNAAGKFELEKLQPINDSQRQALVEYLKTL